MRIASLPVGLFSLLLLSACWGQPSDQGSSASSSSASSVASSVAKASRPASAVEFQKTDNGYLGMVTLTGYVTKREAREPFCETDCKTYQYVFFHITDGANAALQEFLGNNEGNSYAGPGMIGLGCVSDDGKTIQSDVADADTYMSPRNINLADSAVILKSNARNLVTITLNRDYEPGGGEAPACYSHFEYVTVTE